MSDQPEPTVPSIQAIQARIRDVAQTLRDSRSVSPELQTALAERLDELSSVLKEPNAPPAEVAHLAESAALLAQALHDRHDEGLLAKARERLGAAMFQAEAHAPTAVGLARGVINALANIGI
jgi:hypothetical protein